MLLLSIIPLINVNFIHSEEENSSFINDQQIMKTKDRSQKELQGVVDTVSQAKQTNRKVAALETARSYSHGSSY